MLMKGVFAYPPEVVHHEVGSQFSLYANWLAEIAGPMLQWPMHKTNTSCIIPEIDGKSTEGLTVFALKGGNFH